MALNATLPEAAPAFRFEPSSRAASPAELAAARDSAAFGTRFTDHMALADWTADAGWHNARVVAYQPLALDPAAAVLHYAQEIFEGLKVYRHTDGSVRAFRIDANARRFAASAARLDLPALPSELFVASVRDLVRADARWVPDGPERALYVRPFMFAAEPFLGLRSAARVTYAVIACPTGGYLGAGEAVSLWLADGHSRTGRGGTGAAKCGGNYASSLAGQREARENGCAQVLFLDAGTGTFVEEAGTMNLFFVLDDGTLVTPPLDGTILAGVTRDSILALARSAGHAVEERPFSLREWASGAASGRLREVFATGTAAVVAPVERLRGRDGLDLRTPGPGPVTRRLREELTAIQFGRTPDTRGWTFDLGVAP
ncbi:branched-chain amino acid aminotransferase [Actinomadura atramentaria]|uniref:branched-chain amino acid aminotransferase n=1 Tax=Actinomadura atramentaria TaxID=1990 RepID=UPI000369C713|nr:branched-chain amino acid aminotransferase [Actinomadura atramentaria]